MPLDIRLLSGDCPQSLNYHLMSSHDQDLSLCGSCNAVYFVFSASILGNTNSETAKYFANLRRLSNHNVDILWGA